MDWSRDAAEISRRLRAFTPWPGLYTFLDGERVKILEADPVPGAGAGEPGSFRLEGGQLVVAAGGATRLVLARVQRAGRKPVTGAEFARSVNLPGQFQGPR